MLRNLSSWKTVSHNLTKVKIGNWINDKYEYFEMWFKAIEQMICSAYFYGLANTLAKFELAH